MTKFYIIFLFRFMIFMSFLNFALINIFAIDDFDFYGH